MESAPSKRYLHTATLVNNSIYIYGGKSADNYFDDMYILEIGLFILFLKKYHYSILLNLSYHKILGNGF